MNPSHRNLRTQVSGASPAISTVSATTIAPVSAPVTAMQVTPGSASDRILVRSLLADAMRKCSRSRAEVAFSMSELTGTSVTEAQLDKYAAESREDYRFPLELQRAFCIATGDYRLLTFAAEAVGLHLVDDEALALMELGREYLRGKRAAAAVANLESRLEGVRL